MDIKFQGKEVNFWVLDVKFYVCGRKILGLKGKILCFKDIKFKLQNPKKGRQPNNLRRKNLNHNCRGVSPDI